MCHTIAVYSLSGKRRRLPKSSHLRLLQLTFRHRLQRRLLDRQTQARWSMRMCPTHCIVISKTLAGSELCRSLPVSSVLGKMDMRVSWSCKAIINVRNLSPEHRIRTAGRAVHYCVASIRSAEPVSSGSRRHHTAQHRSFPRI